MSLRPFRYAAALLLFAAVLLISDQAISASQDSRSLPKASAVVKAATYVSFEPVPAGKEFQVAVVAQIAAGFHMNSHKPSEDYLIATTLTGQAPAGIQLLDTIYPDGHNEKFSFSPDKPLNVYTGTVILRLHLAAKSDAPLGATEFPLVLRYQACNDTTCLPPVKLPMSVKIDIAAAGAKTRAVHSDIFSTGPAKR
jgi:hypothetical protein